MALQVKRSYDKRDKERFFAFCPICSSRIFLNNWKPGPRSRTIAQAEVEGLHPIGLTREEKAKLLKELGLVERPMPQPMPGYPPMAPNPGWPGPPPQYMPRPAAPKKPKG